MSKNCLKNFNKNIPKSQKKRRLRMKESEKRKGPAGTIVLAALVVMFLTWPLVSSFGEPLVDGFVWLPGGTFKMGSSAPDANEDEKPVHSVTVSGFYLGVSEVTRRQWNDVMGTTPWLEDDGTPKEGVNQGANAAEDDEFPATYISWTQAMAYCAALNTLAGKNLYRLPSEAEWEYAARVGNLGSLLNFSPEIDENNLADYAWFRDNTVLAAEAWPHRVKLKLPTRWSGAATDWLYDMHGNVAEWVLDYYDSYSAAAQTNPGGPSTGVARITRGGSFQESAYIPPGSDCSSANRSPLAESVTNKGIGLRVLRQLSPYTYLPGQGGSSDGGTVVVTPSSKDGGGGGGCFIRTLFSR
jgi:formylglycine-generating enzyme required for sulfatase activity